MPLRCRGFPPPVRLRSRSSHYGDLLVVPLHGGTAHRLLHDAGTITTPLFSPDSRWIAYTSRHGGLHDVFVISAKGGQPKRLTYEASRFADGAMVVSWSPDSKRVIFLSHRATPFTKLVRAFSVPLTGGMAEQLQLDRAGLMSFAPNGHQTAFNRIFRNLELRKRYVGGEQQDIYTYDFDSHFLERRTDWKGTDTSPMWFGRKIYFVSDRGPNFRQTSGASTSTQTSFGKLPISLTMTWTGHHLLLRPSSSSRADTCGPSTCPQRSCGR